MSAIDLLQFQNRHDYQNLVFIITLTVQIYNTYGWKISSGFFEHITQQISIKQLIYFNLVTIQFQFRVSNYVEVNCTLLKEYKKRMKRLI